MSSAYIKHIPLPTAMPAKRLGCLNNLKQTPCLKLLRMTPSGNTLKTTIQFGICNKPEKLGCALKSFQRNLLIWRWNRGCKQGRLHTSSNVCIKWFNRVNTRDEATMHRQDSIQLALEHVQLTARQVVNTIKTSIQ